MSTSLALASAASGAFNAEQQAVAATSAGFSATKEVSRTNLVSGADVVVDKRTVTVKVDQTANLRNGQQLQVSWSNAHPTGGIRLDPHSHDAIYQEFPVVLLLCRGSDSSSAPEKSRVSPRTCWTQYPDERFASASSFAAFPEWRVDRYAPPSERTSSVDAPANRPNSCASSSVEHWLPFVSATGVAYPVGANGCAGMPPEASLIGAGGALALPPMDTFAVTLTDGTGSTRFRVLNSSENASLGCSQTVSCTLEVIPIEGISCDVDAAALPDADRPVTSGQDEATAAECLRNGGYAAGQPARSGSGASDPGVSGALWWSASNWKNRIPVPLGFAPPDNLCDSAAASRGSVNIYGSELLVQATTQWAPTFCLDAKRYPFTHVQVGEPQAANGVATSTGINAAFVADPPSAGWNRPVVMAPTAVTGFGIGYTIDDAKHHEYRSLKLDARLLAKLLTESYPAVTAVKTAYKALEGNPLDLALDPEFQALNPTLTDVSDPGMSAASLLNISAGTDVLTALTSYINADPEARAWLDGAPDPWGMVVNPNYKGIKLPVDTWPLLDSFEPSDLYRPGINDCLHDNPVPFLPLVSAPLSRFSFVTLSMQFSIANAQVTCSQPIFGSTEGEKLTALGRQSSGFRFLLGIVPLADAARYGINTAALETQVSSSAPAKFTDATGRAFVAPTTASLKAAMAMSHWNSSTGTWPMPYDKWRSDSAGGAAYPGTMLLSTAIPTKGLTPSDATHYADFLDFVAASGQRSGTSAGQLPAGYLPMTSGNGLGALATYTTYAADAVRSQSGTVPPLTGPTASPTATPTPSTSPSSTGPGTESIPSSTSTLPQTSAQAPKPSASPTSAPSVAIQQLGKTGSVQAGLGTNAVPLLIFLAALGAAVVVAVIISAEIGRRR